MRTFKLGDKGENLVLNVFKQNGIEVQKNKDTDKLSYYDLVCKLGKKKFTVEVKYDWMAQKTGNIAIEYWNTKQDKPSGIQITKADLWVHCLQDGANIVAWITKTADLKQFLKDNSPDFTRENNKSGDDNAMLLLYKEHRILEIFERLETLQEKPLKTLIRRLLK